MHTLVAEDGEEDDGLLGDDAEEKPEYNKLTMPGVSNTVILLSYCCID